MLKNPLFVSTLLLLLLPANLFAQKRNATTENYIKTYAPIAIANRNEFHIPASIILAQGVLESGSGTSPLAQKARNHFGIKCHKQWKGKKYYQDDDAPGECFRVYKTVQESFADHALFLTSKKRYAFLFDLPIHDYKGWAEGLKKAGYATNKQYPQLLIGIIETYGLSVFDTMTTAVLRTSDKPQANHSERLAVKTVKPAQNKQKRSFCQWFRDLFKRKTDKNPNQPNFIVEELPQYDEDLYDKADFVILFDSLSVTTDYSPATPVKARTHVVRKGETLYSIAKRYQITVDVLRQRNNLNPTTVLKVGDVLRIE